MKVGGGNNYKLQNIGKAKLWQEVRLTTSIKCNDEALDIFNAPLNVYTEGMVGSVPDGFDMLMESMDVFNMFLSDTDDTFAAENELEPIYLNE